MLAGAGVAVAAVAAPLYFTSADKLAATSTSPPAVRAQAPVAREHAARAQPAARRETPEKLKAAAKAPDAEAAGPSGNPLYAFSRALSDTCPVDFIGAGRDIGEALGLIAPARHSGGKFADAIRNAQLDDRANMPLYKKLMQRSCLLSKLFGDGSCAKN